MIDKDFDDDEEFQMSFWDEVMGEGDAWPKVFVSWCDPIYCIQPKVFSSLRSFEDYFEDIFVHSGMTIDDAMNEGLLGYHIQEVRR